jgi:hypothetical protein
MFEATGNYHSASIYTAGMMFAAIVALFGMPAPEAHKASILEQLEVVRQAQAADGAQRPEKTSLEAIRLAPASAA